MTERRTLVLALTLEDAMALRSACTAFDPGAFLAAAIATVVVPGGREATAAQLREVRARLDTLIALHQRVRPDSSHR